MEIIELKIYFCFICNHSILCFEHKCFQKWLYGTDEGKETLNRHTIKAKKETKHKERLQDQKQKIDLMSLSKVKSTMIQPKINELVRIIDNGQPCIATGNFGKMNAGHFYHAGGSSQIRFNLHNIHIQSFESNHFKSGDAMASSIASCALLSPSTSALPKMATPPFFITVQTSAKSTII